MAELRIIVKGSQSDHIFDSPELSDEDARDQLTSVAENLGTTGVITLPWLVVQGDQVIGAQLSGVRS